MRVMQFRYKAYRRDHSIEFERPVIEVILRNPRDPIAPAIAYEALVDSGSDRCIFPAELAELIGIDIMANPKLVRNVGGVVANERRPVYFHPVEVSVGGYNGPTFRTTIGFMPDFSRSGHGLLGRDGFFDRFTFVKFKDFARLLEIGNLR